MLLQKDCIGFVFVLGAYKEGKGEECMDMDEIYRKYNNIVLKYLMCQCHDAHLAEELTQETFFRAIRSVHRYDGSCKMSTWLCQIAKHVWYQELDKRERRKTVPLEETMADRQASPENKAVFSQSKMELFKQIHKLSETEKEVVYLRLTGEFSFREIGKIFEKNENWARVTYYRAKQKLIGGMQE